MSAVNGMMVVSAKGEQQWSAKVVRECGVSEGAVVVRASGAGSSRSHTGRSGGVTVTRVSLQHYAHYSDSTMPLQKVSSSRTRHLNIPN